MFAGGGNIRLNISANKIILNDNLAYLIDLYKNCKKTPMKKVLEHVYKRIDEYALSISNKEGYIKLREYYNKTKDPLDLFVLISY
ncbi:hypothetical protein ATZ36_06150 [Candidatus Endomicrobiellum trichonymphae]|uniref:site-specific DNA-methyltransferase (adenine-specific) n=1 Tax=Endomicrobium trichonymphae TaxID=1408204 RepID=A0A1E5II65_ENDTX|nr:hypothetical protein ATZ36_06150 [Candidatus Endomicrobium trichonymphae]